MPVAPAAPSPDHAPPRAPFTPQQEHSEPARARAVGVPVALGPTDPSRANISRKRLRLGFRGSTDRAEAPPPRLATRADGASNNKHAPRIRKRDQRRARILRWASSRRPRRPSVAVLPCGARILALERAETQRRASQRLSVHGQFASAFLIQARDPIALASKRAAAIATAIAGTASSTVGAALAAALAPYQAPATATAVTCRGTAASLLRLPRITSVKCNGHHVM